MLNVRDEEGWEDRVEGRARKDGLDAERVAVDVCRRAGVERAARAKEREIEAGSDEAMVRSCYTQLSRGFRIDRKLNGCWRERGMG